MHRRLYGQRRRSVISFENITEKSYKTSEYERLFLISCLGVPLVMGYGY